MQVNTCMSSGSLARNPAVQINEGNVSFPPKSVFRSQVMAAIHAPRSLWRYSATIRETVGSLTS
jgi:hypothetical protein